MKYLGIVILTLIGLVFLSISASWTSGGSNEERPVYYGIGAAFLVSAFILWRLS